MSAKHLTALFALGLLIIITAGHFLVIRPQGEEIRLQHENVKEGRLKLLKLRKVALRINDLKVRIARLEEGLKFFEDKLPKQKEVDVILKQMWVIASNSGLATGKVLSLKPQDGLRYNIQPIQITFDGTFGGFYSFLLALERLPRITKVRDMELKKPEKARRAKEEEENRVVEGTRIEANVMMEVFFEKKQSRDEE